MKLILIVIINFFSLSLFSQVVVGKEWTFECGASSINAFKTSSSLNVRFVSPRFKWSNDYLSEEEEKQPEIYKGMRLMFELIYSPPLKVICTGFNAQYRLLRYKRLSLEVYGGPKFFFAKGPDFAAIPYLQKDIWYINMGLICQVNLGIIAPFADIGGDKIITIGTEFNLHKIYKKTNKRYNLHPRKT